MKKRRKDNHYLANDNTDDYGQLIFMNDQYIITPDLTGDKHSWWKVFSRLGERPERIGCFNQTLQKKIGD